MNKKYNYCLSKIIDHLFCRHIEGFSPLIIFNLLNLINFTLLNNNTKKSKIIKEILVKNNQKISR